MLRKELNFHAALSTNYLDHILSISTDLLEVLEPWQHSQAPLNKPLHNQRWLSAAPEVMLPAGTAVGRKEGRERSNGKIAPLPKMLPGSSQGQS